MNKYKQVRKVLLVCIFAAAAVAGRAALNTTEPVKKSLQYEWSTYVTENLRYPPEALEAGIWGDVTVEFTVSAAGRITHIKSRGDSKLLRQEAERLVRESEGIWQQCAACTISQKISFRLQMEFEDSSKE